MNLTALGWAPTWYFIVATDKTSGQKQHHTESINILGRLIKIPRWTLQVDLMIKTRGVNSVNDFH